MRQDLAEQVGLPADVVALELAAERAPVAAGEEAAARVREAHVTGPADLQRHRRGPAAWTAPRSVEGLRRH